MDTQAGAVGGAAGGKLQGPGDGCKPQKPCCEATTGCETTSSSCQSLTSPPPDVNPVNAIAGNFRKLAAAFDFSRYRSLADFGGSTGCLCVCVAQAHPHVACTTYDLPPVHAVAEAYVRDQGAQAAVAVRDWDFFSEQPFPSGHDVVAFGMVLHDWGEARKRQLVRKAYEALPPGGVLIAVDNLIDDDRRRCVTGLGMSLDMLLEFGAEASFDYSFAEFTAWATAAGFARTECLPLVGDAKAAVAYK